jgi:N-acetyl-gamma-glutamyl-phosphate reductase
MNKPRVGIINVSGYTGVELARLLSQHPAVELTSVTGRSRAGKRLGEVFPHLAGIELNIEAELSEVSLAFCAMPHKESAEVVIPLLSRDIRVSPQGCYRIPHLVRLYPPRPTTAQPSSVRLARAISP